MQISVDVTVARCPLSLEELNSLQAGQVKGLEGFVQSEVLLKSGDSVVAKGTLIKVEGAYCVAIDRVFPVADADPGAAAHQGSG